MKVTKMSLSFLYILYESIIAHLRSIKEGRAHKKKIPKMAFIYKRDKIFFSAILYVLALMLLLFSFLNSFHYYYFR